MVMDAETEIKTEENDSIVEELNEESFRIKLANLPNFLKYPQLKKFLEGWLKGIDWRKLRAVPGTAYFSLKNAEDTEKVLQKLDGMIFKNKKLVAKRAAPEPELKTKAQIREDKPPLSAAEIATPLYNLSYGEQLQKKYEDVVNVKNMLCKQLRKANAPCSISARNADLLKKVVPSPILDSYRNKCQFTVGRDEVGETRVGLVSGHMADRKVIVVSAKDCNIMTENTRNIAAKFEEYIQKSDLEVFDEFARTGFWKMLTVRDHLTDCMVIVTVHPHSDTDALARVKKELSELFIRVGDFSGSDAYHVTSLYWQTIENASDALVYEHVAGVPYIYETLLDTRFRISPATFFQTNTKAAAVLYTIVGDLLGLPNGNSLNDTTDNEEGKPLVLLDICCGAGTIGQCLLRRIERSAKYANSQKKFACVGVELVEEAVRDARVNAQSNGFDSKRCRYVAGKAEIVFRDLDQHLPEGMAISESSVVGVLDPPRAGLSDKVIISCRRLENLKTLVYVSCDPQAALKNILDLCRPESKKFDGCHFNLQSIHPVDMFPQTNHCECVFLLTRVSS